MKNKLVRYGMLKLLLLLCVQPAIAQTQIVQPSPFQQFTDWLKTQQAYVGLATPIVGKLYKESYITTWWDVFQYGETGFNVGKGDLSKDDIDIGVAVDALQDKPTRYGMTIPIHPGNIYNSLSSHLSVSTKSHINLIALPNFIIAPQFLFPLKGLSKFSWKPDFFLTFAWGFGGPSGQVP